MVSRVQLALYRRPKLARPHEWLAHVVTCAALTIRHRKFCRYSHAELVVDGVSHTASIRDGCVVRAKVIEFNDDRWDVVDIPSANPEQALLRFAERKGLSYDFLGAIRAGLGFLPQAENRDYCFELVAYMLELDNPEDWGPVDLKQYAESFNLTPEL